MRAFGLVLTQTIAPTFFTDLGAACKFAVAAKNKPFPAVLSAGLAGASTSSLWPNVRQSEYNLKKFWPLTASFFETGNVVPRVLELKDHAEIGAELDRLRRENGEWDLAR